MKYRLFLVAVLLLASSLYSAEKEYTKYVNPFNGTDFHGHTFPGAVYPFGMIQLSPDTRLTGWDGCSGYHYSDSVIYGFSHTHLSGTGASDYGDILMMPVDGYKLTLGIKKEEYASGFSHKRENASPGFYSVFLDKWRVNTSLTAGKRAAIHKYVFNKKGSEPGLIIDLTHRDEVLDSKITIKNGTIIEGYRRSRQWADDQMVCFHIELSSPADAVFYLNDVPVSGTESIRGKNCKLYLSFKKGTNKTIYAKIGISSVSEENAKLNLDSEVKEFDFNALRLSARNAWNEFLSRIEVEKSGGKDATDLLKTFYTALYHSAIHPTLYSDVNGEYRGMDRKVHKAEGYEQYTVFSLWDTFRALHPLLSIIDEKRTNDFINSFLAIYREGGKLPIWELSGCETDCMIAYHSVPVIADAYIKGIRGFDAKEALRAMIASSDKNEYGKEQYLKYGYLPAEMEHESVSKTLEYSYDDWTIARFAESIGEKEIYNQYIKRAQYYKNLFDPESGFMRPKLNGAWLSPFIPSEVNNHFTEANSWQYSFFVPQDINGHIAMLGGDKAYCKKLDELFSASTETTGRTQVDITGLIGQYAHGNEPSQHIAYLYNYAGEAWKTQQMVHQIETTLYNWKPDGICGNDDCGQTSAWFVMSSMGFYQVSPGRADYIIGSPMFDRVRIRLENGKNFTIIANNRFGKALTKNDFYIKSIALNGKPYSKSWFTHNDILEGSTFDFTMDSKPDIEFGAAKSDRPQSDIETAFVINPWFEYKSKVFRDSLTVTIRTPDAGAEIWYRVSPMPQLIKYTAPFVVKNNCQAEAIAVKSSGNGGETSCFVPASFIKVNGERSIKIKSQYSKQYTAGGDEGIIDGLRGALNFRLGGWQGYQNTDFEAVVDLGSLKQVTRLGAGFLQDAKAWIWMPKYVEFSVSADGTNFVPLGRVNNSVAEDDLNVQIKDMYLGYSDFLNNPGAVRFIKIFARNIGTIPSWHPGAGDKGYIFIDEIFTE
jgi:predicted alpha-1,2-mannosidase